MATTDDLLIRRPEPRALATLGRLSATLVRAHHAFDAHRFLTPGSRLEEGYTHFLGTQLANLRR
jgi:hypothetical protein